MISKEQFFQPAQPITNCDGSYTNLLSGYTHLCTDNKLYMFMQPEMFNMIMDWTNK